MNLKPTASVALSAGLIVGASVFGAWWGHTSEWTTVSSTPALPVATVTQDSGPEVIFPPSHTSEAQQATNSPGSTVPTTAPPKTPDIVPGGAVAGSAVQRMWEANANLPWTVRATPITPPNWYITGVVQRGEKTQIIVQFDGEAAPRMLNIGDTLPGGGKLAWVRPGTIGVITPKRQRLGIPVLPGRQESGGVRSAGPGSAAPAKLSPLPAR